MEHVENDSEKQASVKYPKVKKRQRKIRNENRKRTLEHANIVFKKRNPVKMIVIVVKNSFVVFVIMELKEDVRKIQKIKITKNDDEVSHVITVTITVATLIFTVRSLDGRLF